MLFQQLTLFNLQLFAFIASQFNDFEINGVKQWKKKMEIILAVDKKKKKSVTITNCMYTCCWRNVSNCTGTSYQYVHFNSLKWFTPFIFVHWNHIVIVRLSDTVARACEISRFNRNGCSVPISTRSNHLLRFCFSFLLFLAALNFMCTTRIFSFSPQFDKGHHSGIDTCDPKSCYIWWN